LDHFIAKSASAHKKNSYYTFATSYCTFCVGYHTILGPGANIVKDCLENRVVLYRDILLGPGPTYPLPLYVTR